MTRRPGFSAAAVAAGLALLLAAEWVLPGPAPPILGQAPGIPGSAPDQAADAAIAQWGATALARPLFDATRRPVDLTAAAAVDDTLPRLAGIIVSGGTSTAIFAMPGEKPQPVIQGGEIGAYRLTAVFPGRVELLGPDGPVTLHPQFVTPAPAAVGN